MKLLSAVPYELSTLMPNMSVSMDYLISDGRKKYSITFDLIGEKGDIRLTRKTEEVFYHGNRVVSHVRAEPVQNAPIVNPDHMPVEHRKYLRYNADDFTAWSRRSGAVQNRLSEHF